ncbi:MAG: hypothetical protein J7L47_10035 [Candidatus Odinarchaeota archaeon]|nr:hypothetical protein [Candidatus Odinarchaeota archaeon]
MSELKFCPKCGTLMKKMSRASEVLFVCPACGYVEASVGQPIEFTPAHSSKKRKHSTRELYRRYSNLRETKTQVEFKLITSTDKRILRDMMERYTKSSSQRSEENLSENYREYFSWDARVSWRILREAGYRTLSENLFSTPQDIDNLLFDDFDEYILQFGKIRFRGRTQKITIRYLFEDLLYRFSYEDIIDFIESDELVVLGHLSWTNLYRQKEYIRENWSYAKEFLKKILFGKNGNYISQVSEEEVYQRLNKAHPYPKGFGKNIITAILMVCDNKRRFGLWNNITTKALMNQGFRGISSTGFSLKKYIKLNKILKQIMNNFGFVDLVDIDMWAWWSTTYQEKYNHLT